MSPYKSKSIVEFWRCWHITLSRFLKDYLYVPLGGNKKGKAKRYRNLMVTMLLGGLWHGADWTFVVWGGLHGIYLVINHFWRWIVKKWKITWVQGESLFFKWVYLLITFFSVTFAWIFFRANNFHDAKLIIINLFENYNVNFTSHDRRWLLIIAFLLIVSWFFPNTQQILSNFEPILETGRIIENKILKWFPNVLWAVVLSIMAIVVVINLGHNTAFIYFDF